MPSRLSNASRDPSRGWRRLVPVVALALAWRAASGQNVMPRGAQRDVSQVVVLDTTLVPPVVPREFRGVWISSADGGDWPSRSGLSAAAQQSELIALIERARAIGLNAVIFHVRLSCDALYATSLAPWSAKLTGIQEVAPGYDPLAVAVREAHARGLQVHAWFNPFRASLDGKIRAAPTHVTKTHPGWVRRYGPQLWIDPGIPEAREAVIATILDVVQRYDIDGVHLDDFFYPYRETRTLTRRVGRGHRRHTVRFTRELAFPDAASWHRYGLRAQWTDRAHWRRHNIDDFVATLYRRVHESKPWLLVGVSPFGIWRAGTPAGIAGLDAYRETYADSRKWLREGWVDYLAPQLYWPIEGPQNRFRALDAWWRSQNPLGRSLWPGLYTAGSVGHAVWAVDEIPRQIATLRQARQGSVEANGHIHFRLGSLVLGSGPLAGALADRLETEDYSAPALVPEAQWLPGKPPAAPLALVADAGGGGGPVLLLAVRDTTPLAWWLIQTRAMRGRWTTTVLPATTRQLALDDALSSPDIAVISAIDRVGRSSVPTSIRVHRGR
ncbi:MAG: hypothetical protein NVS4B3_12130 [Gemmatimonadaceae bacterium]